MRAIWCTTRTYVGWDVGVCVCLCGCSTALFRLN